MTTFSSMSEWTEMLIGLAALAYVILKREDVTRLTIVQP